MHLFLSRVLSREITKQFIWIILLRVRTHCFGRIRGVHLAVKKIERDVVLDVIQYNEMKIKLLQIFLEG